MKILFKIMLFNILFLVSAQLILGQGLPKTKPEDMGLSSNRLDRIKPVMQDYVDKGKLSGLITMVARKGNVVHFEKYGKMNIEANKPMEFNTIFRIFSMTKPITSVAVMILYEEGRFQLSDPISKYIPEFKDVKVFSSVDKEGIKLEIPEREITVHDLLTHTSGLTYGIFGNTPVDSMYREANLLSADGTLKDMTMKLANLPLKFHPGTQWNYSLSTDVLAYFVEVISGKSFDEFLEERIFSPLKMDDTGFYVPKDKKDRLSAWYSLGRNGLQLIDDPENSTYTKPPKFMSGGGGLVSTASDYVRFSQMLLNKGELEGTRILGRKTVEFMTQNHLADGVNSNTPGYGFGLGFGVLEDVAKTRQIGSIGEYNWAGIANTFFRIDPEEKLILILMTQFNPFSYYPINNEFKVLVYQSLID